MGAHTFSGSLGTSASLTVGTPIPESGAVLPDQVEPVVASMVAKARLTPHAFVHGPWPPLAAPRARKGVYMSMPTPAVIAGKPVVPKVFGHIALTGTALTGSGHMRGFADPDPVWDGSEWTTPPPAAPAGSNFVRWTARSLPDPAGFPGGRYLLGHRTAEDGTSSLSSGVESWPSTPGSDYAIPWLSAYPFKPLVQSHIHYGPDGAIHTVDRAVHLFTHRLAHMWADFGTLMTPPFTMIWVGVVLHVPGLTPMSYLFDSGYDPTPALSAAQKASIYSRGASGLIRLSENEGYRNALRIGNHQAQTFNDMTLQAGRIGRVPFTHTLKPKMICMIVNGASSRLVVYDTSRVYERKFTLTNHGAQRLWLMGRANGRLDPLRAASAAIFEMRVWDQALADVHLEAQFDQLSATWHFASYDREIRNYIRAQT